MSIRTEITVLCETFRIDHLEFEAIKGNINRIVLGNSLAIIHHLQILESRLYYTKYNK